VNTDRDQVPSAASGPPILLDVTIRDGGYVNGHTWTVTQAASIVRAMEEARVPFVEVGYLRDPLGSPLHPSAHCPPAYLRTLADRVRRTRLVVMVRPGETDPQAMKGLAESGVGMVRVVVPRLDVAAALPYLEAADAEGLATAVNLTHASRFTPGQLGDAVRQAARAGARIVYLADSNGSLYPDSTAARIRAAVEAASAVDGTTVGFHPHDNLGLAFANTRAALDAGAGAVDASIGGVGKGGGNLRLELVAAYLVMYAGADYSVDPLMDNESTVAAQVRMFVDSGAKALMSGLLDVSLDQSRGFQEEAARHGYDVLLRAGAHTSPQQTPEPGRSAVGAGD
jgi:4-hydroxy 2-oxovalerate aldolase